MNCVSQPFPLCLPSDTTLRCATVPVDLEAVTLWVDSDPVDGEGAEFVLSKRPPWGARPSSARRRVEATGAIDAHAEDYLDLGAAACARARGEGNVCVCVRVCGVFGTLWMTRNRVNVMLCDAMQSLVARDVVSL